MVDRFDCVCVFAWLFGADCFCFVFNSILFFRPLLTSYDCGDDVFQKNVTNGMECSSTEIENVRSLFSIVFVAVADGGGEHEKIDFHFSSFFSSLFYFSHSRSLIRYSFWSKFVRLFLNDYRKWMACKQKQSGKTIKLAKEMRKSTRTNDKVKGNESKLNKFSFDFRCEHFHVLQRSFSSLIFPLCSLSLAFAFFSTDTKGKLFPQAHDSFV